jgi:ABC-type multidrug transport system ATPase subunit/pSer/pThr/pTyr-binding forkhead associated (FHA) protein
MAGSRLSIGRASDNDLRINAPEVSSHHAALVMTNEGLLIEDLGSTNGTFVDGRRIASSPVTRGQEILFSQTISLDWNEGVVSEWLKTAQASSVTRLGSSTGGIYKGWSFQVPDSGSTELTIGRQGDCEFVISHPRISRVHAVLRRNADGSWIIEDKGSSNGTFVDGKRVSTAPLTPASKIVLGGIPVRIDLGIGKPLQEAVEPEGEANISLRDLTVAVPDGDSTRIILNRISLDIKPGRFIGLIGPSGSGKTTLLMAMNAYIQPAMGSVTINGINVHEERDLLRGLIGYVPQDDIVHRELTVGRCLGYNARLRLPPDLTEEERNQEVDMVVESLGLERTVDTLIGSPEKKGISGGQRKRVNLAQELLTRPSILFLDEPCSGLDPKSEHEVMKLLRGLCDSGKTVILTTHNPSLRNLALLDDLIVMARGGRLAYSGPAQAAAGYFGADYPEEIFEILETDSPESWESRFRGKIPAPSGSAVSSVQPGMAEAASAKKTSFSRKLVILCSRYAETRWNDRIQTIIPISVPLLIGVILTVINEQMQIRPSQATIFFMMVVSASLFGVLNSAREIVSERAIFKRESLVFLDTGSYVLSKSIILGLLCLIQCAILLGICMATCGLDGDFFGHLLGLFLVSLASIQMGLFLSCLASTEATAMMFVPAMIIPQVVLGGSVFVFGHMKDAIKAVCGLVASRWGFEAAMIEAGVEKNVTDLGFTFSRHGQDTAYLMLVALSLLFGSLTVWRTGRLGR